jgi:hypothetical protein
LGIYSRNSQPKPQLYIVNGQLSVDPKWEHLDRRIFPPRPITPSPHQHSAPATIPPIQKDGYRRKPLPPKDDGAIVLNFIAVKVCTIKGCYQPVPAEYEKKTCLDCQERYKGYAVTKRAKRKALKHGQTSTGPEASGSMTSGEDHRANNAPDSVEGDDMDMSGVGEDLGDEGSGADDDGFEPEFGMNVDREIPIDPAIQTKQSSPTKVTNVSCTSLGGGLNSS